MSHADPTSVNLQQGATGVPFTAQLLDASGTPITFPDPPNVAEFRFKRPQGAGSEALVVKGIPEAVDTSLGPSDGTLSWTVPDAETDFLDRAGLWQVQAHVRVGPTGPYILGPVRNFTVDRALA